MLLLYVNDIHFHSILYIYLNLFLLYILRQYTLFINTFYLSDIIIIIIMTSFVAISSKIKQARWRDKTKGLSKLVIVKQCVSRLWMDEEAMKLRGIGNIKEIGF